MFFGFYGIVLPITVTIACVYIYIYTLLYIQTCLVFGKVVASRLISQGIFQGWFGNWSRQWNPNVNCNRVCCKLTTTIVTLTSTTGVRKIRNYNIREMPGDPGLFGGMFSMTNFMAFSRLRVANGFEYGYFGLFGMLAFVFLWRLCFFWVALSGIYIIPRYAWMILDISKQRNSKVSMASWQLVSLRYGWNWLKVPNQWHNWSYSVLTSPMLVKELWIIYQLETTYILL